ncbi:hypothetical protein ABZ815_42665 [Nonomuraea sp. NPDC047529]|uniref:hypothetical protein n=1 Tax=Nonomuraea sp. NPDC047529 TaxID=3155623 RepID=UPI0033ECF20D
MTYRYRSEYAEMLRAEGQVHGGVRALLLLLDHRGVVVPDAARKRITSCTDTTVIETWIGRAVHATSLSDVFDDGGPVRPGGV